MPFTCLKRINFILLVKPVNVAKYLFVTKFCWNGCLVDQKLKNSLQLSNNYVSGYELNLHVKAIYIFIHYIIQYMSHG